MLDLVATRSGRRVLFVMATQAEYGAHLRQRFEPFITGVGPVEGGIMLAAALGEARAQARLPDLVVSLGSAGSRRLEQGEVYQAEAIAYRDMDASPLGFEKGRTPFLDLPARISAPMRIDGVKTATLSTGGSIISGAAYDAISEDMVDMETFAHLRAAMHFGVPLIGLRGISDGAEDLRHFDDWASALPALDEHLATAVDRVLAQA
jgi:adenosylhomocysteine nucleosidase